MPTTKPRHAITETDEVTRALDEAARVWPEDADARSRLLLHLIHEGYQRILEHRRDRATRTEAAVRRTSGRLTGAYPDGYLAQLRSEWPE